MLTVRHAVIDIGTNSVKLLVAECQGQALIPLWEGSEQTRLGRGLYDQGTLRPDTIAHTAQAVATFARQAADWNVTSLRVLATSAAREARNQNDLLEAIRRACGLEVDIISGEQEAEWAFAGVCTDAALADGALLILDVGGGITEFILGQQGHLQFRGSFPMVTVRLLEQLRPGGPPSSQDWEITRQRLEEQFRDAVQPALHPWLERWSGRSRRLVGTGGTTSILAAMEAGLKTFDRQQIEKARLSRERVSEYQRALWSQPLARRQELPGLPRNRADVILFGVAIFEVTMDILGFNEVWVSTRGLRFGAAAALAGLCRPAR